MSAERKANVSEGEAMEARVLRRQLDVGAAYTVGAKEFATAAHAVECASKEEIELTLSTGQKIAIVDIALLPRFDLAVLQHQEDLPVSSAAEAVPGSRWHTKSSPPNEPILSGRVDGQPRAYSSAGGLSANLIQLLVDQNLKSYRGYSGTAVFDESSHMIGMLVEEALERTPDLSRRREAANVLWALPMTTIRDAIAPRQPLVVANTARVLLADQQVSISSAFWAGDFAGAATLSRNLLMTSRRLLDHDSAALALSNLVLISRSRPGMSKVRHVIRDNMHTISLRRVDPTYRYRLMKELFIYYHELGRNDLAAAYMDRMSRIDSSLMSYSPGDDWIPGTLRWRKAHLDWLLDPSRRQLLNSLAVAHEGIDYLQDRLHVNPRGAGIASAYNNTAWLYFIADDPICLDYFAEAAHMAGDEAPRVRLEANCGLAVAESKFRVISRDEALRRLMRGHTMLTKSGFALRNYSFLANSEEYDLLVLPSLR